MACAQKNHLPLAESMPLEGEKGLTYYEFGCQNHQRLKALKFLNLK